ncbi:MAG: hypothetical protein LBH69_03290 [Methanomassiliicoccaceae archaeon]|jgi:hypothetical protein|nr:hypothetical protein [Methanomassiliicoccaceae archaeon]
MDRVTVRARVRDATDKANSPWWWKLDKAGKWKHRLALMELSDELIKLNVDFDKIVIDDDTSLRHVEGRKKLRIVFDGKEIVKSRVGSVRNIKQISQENSQSGKNKNLLQTNDFALGSIGRELRNSKKLTKVRYEAKNIHTGERKSNK